jgi:dipeptidase E
MMANMKLLLTSNGLSNGSIANALEELVGKPRKQTRVAFIPNAGFPVDDFKNESRDWLVNDMYRIKQFCGFIDIVSLADLTNEQILERLEYADVIFVGGGNAFYLSYCMEKTGLFDELPNLLKTRVYAGISAGSMMATESLRTASGAINNRNKFYDEEYEEMGPEGRSAGRSAKLVNFVVRPHLNSKHFPNIRGNYLEEIAKDVKVPLYAIDDNSAVKVKDGKIEVVSEGEWKLYDR